MGLASRMAAAAAMAGACVTVAPAAVVADATIAGRVIDAQTGAALAGAVVRLHKVGILGTSEPAVLSDADGSFAFGHVSTGLWTVSANLEGYGAGLSGVTAPGDQPVTTEILDTDSLRDVIVRMFKRATVAGRVTDARGRPVADAAIWSISKHWVGGRQLQRAAQSARTNEQGEYRLSVVTPGEYVFAVTARPSPQLATAMPVYYGNSGRQAGAKKLVIGVGDELTRIDFAFPAESSTSIDGRLVGVDDVRQRFTVQLTPMEAVGVPGLIPVGVTTVDFTGRFGFRGIREGEYQVSILRLPGSADSANDRPPLGFVRLDGGSLEFLVAATPEGPTWYSEQLVRVGGDGAHDVKVSLSQGRRLAGRVLFDGTADKPQVDRLHGIVIMAQHERSWAGMPFQARVEADGSFRTVGLPPGEYALSVTGIPKGWSLGAFSDSNGTDLTVRDVVLGASDIGNLVVTLNDRETKLLGTVVDQAGIPAVGEVVVFPADQQQWADFNSASPRFRRIATTDRGNYSTTALVPGEYLLVAVHQGSRVQFESGVLSRLAALATRATLAPGKTTSARLTAQRIR